MTTTTPSFTYRAQTDPSTKTWHLGSEELGAKCVCGCMLIEPGDTRPWALRVPADARHYETDPDVSKVTCGSCKRNRAYAKATAAPLAEAAAGLQVLDAGAGLQVLGAGAARPSRRRASTRTATPAEAGAGLNESTAAQLLVDGVQARARRRAKSPAARDRELQRDADRALAGIEAAAGRRRGRPAATGDPRADRAAAENPDTYAERVAAAQTAAARAARDAG